MAYPRWAWISTFVLTIAGLGISIYLTYEHASGSNSLACPDTGFFNCNLVTTSKYSTLGGAPVAYLGLAFFLGAAGLFCPWAWRLTSPIIRLARMASVAIGLVMVGYLVWAELYRIHAICLWCTSVHVITLLMFIVTLFAEVGGPRSDDLEWLDVLDDEE
ncbi:MAG TPA: vitamin K epoxide reductase family protein [Marmoricola sp.]|nr:vitamin K epoxide reductase family protein [Marmoricola sp.]